MIRGSSSASVVSRYAFPAMVLPWEMAIVGSTLTDGRAVSLLNSEQTALPLLPKFAAMGATEEQKILGIVRDVLGKPGLGFDDDLFDHGGTSLSFVRVLAEINQELHVRVRAGDLQGVATPRRIAACAASGQGAATADS
ncbi:acyl carrier protein [Streptomyces parvus]|uniref:Acyl carrier protein n=2 Tax=Streptomyces parvus TaxID=66428 RepID=A0A7K3S5Z8_9ACTN|nr:acyl carrier protein [Streptomyces parvus]